MSGANATRRTRVEPGVYERRNAAGQKVLEIGFRDAGGKQRWRVVEGGIKAARAALAEAHAQRSRGVRVTADPRLTFDQAADQWWEAHAVQQRATTQSAYGAGLKHLRTAFGRYRLSDITVDDVARYVARKEREGLKGWTVRGHLTVLSSVFNHSARRLGFVGVNPVGLLARSERPDMDDEKPKRILTHAELGRLLAAVDDRYRPLFELASDTGARLSEVLGLVWENVDTEAQSISFTHQLNRKGERVPLKTRGSRRVLEVTPELVATLRRLRVASRYSEPFDFVFVNVRGGGLEQRNVGGRVLARAVKRAGLEAVERAGVVVQPAPTFHDLRHSHASALIAQGWDIAEVSARLGHSDVATTQRIYVHQFDAAARSEERRGRLVALRSERESLPRAV